jgi:myosin-5
MLAVLESQRSARLFQLVTLVQKNVRRWIEMKKYRKLRKDTVLIQARWRGILGRRYVEEKKKEVAAIRIQRVVRGWMARKRYLEVRNAVIKIQSGTSCIW